MTSEKWEQFKYNNDPQQYFQQLDKYFLSEIGLLPFAVLPVDSQKMVPHCYRVRKYHESINPHLISDFSFPPASACTSIMRANLPHYPVFYASPDIKTAMIETMSSTFEKEQDNAYFISEWSFRPGYQFILAPFIYDNVSEKNIFRNLTPGIFKNMERQFTELSPDELQSLREVLQFFSRLFVEEDNHIVSSYIAHSYLYANHSLRPDVFLYPSIQTERHMINFAIHPNTVVHKMVLNKVYYVKVKDYVYRKGSSEVTMNFSFDQFANNQNGILIWQPFNDGTAEEFKKLFSGSDK